MALVLSSSRLGVENFPTLKRALFALLKRVFVSSPSVKINLDLVVS
jgi:hypothetical protein